MGKHYQKRKHIRRKEEFVPVTFFDMNSLNFEFKPNQLFEGGIRNNVIALIGDDMLLYNDRLLIIKEQYCSGCLKKFDKSELHKVLDGSDLTPEVALCKECYDKLKKLSV